MSSLCILTRPDKKNKEVFIIDIAIIKKNQTSNNIRTLLIFIADGAPGKPINEKEHSNYVSNDGKRGKSGSRRIVGVHLIGWIKQILPCDRLRTQYAQTNTLFCSISKHKLLKHIYNQLTRQTSLESGHITE